MTKAPFRWSPEAIATLRQMYLANATRKAIGAAVGCTEAQVMRKIEGLRLVDEATPEQRAARKAAARATAQAGRRRQLAEQGRLFDWTPERQEEHRRLLLDEKLTYNEVAVRMGASRSVIIRQAERTGIDEMRDRDEFARRRNAALSQGRPLAGAGRSRAKQKRLEDASRARAEKLAAKQALAPAPAHSHRDVRSRDQAKPASKPVAANDDRALIDAAIAAGRVTVVPSGRAAGFSRLELDLGFSAQPIRSKISTQASRKGRAA